MSMADEIVKVQVGERKQHNIAATEIVEIPV